MSVQIENLEKNMAKLTVEVSPETMEKAMNSVYLRSRGSIALPGFRKGKAPRKMIERMYGAGVFLEDAANDVIPEEYRKAVEESNLEIVSQPEIAVVQLEPGKPFVFTAEVAVKPDVTLGEYKGIEVPKTEIEVTDEEVEAEVKKEQEKNSRFVAVEDRGAENGDRVTLDFDGSVDGEAFEGGKGTDYPLTLGSGTFIPGFEEQLIGVKAEDHVDVTVTFPEEYHNADLAGQDVVFAITLNFIYPEITDEVVAAMENSKYGTKEEFYNYAREVVGNDAEEKNANAITTLAFEKILENSTFKEIPDIVRENQKADLEKKYAVAIEGGAGGLDSVIQYLYGCSADELIEVYSKQRMVTQAIAKEEGITVTDEEVNARLEEVGAMYGMDGENYLKVNEISREKFKELMISEKVQQFVYENTNTPTAE